MVLAVNEARKRNMAAATLGGNVRDKIMTVLALTFKPNTDDMRDSPSIPLITAAGHACKVRAYNPVGMEQAPQGPPQY